MCVSSICHILCRKRYICTRWGYLLGFIAKSIHVILPLVKFIQMVSPYHCIISERTAFLRISSECLYLHSSMRGLVEQNQNCQKHFSSCLLLAQPSGGERDLVSGTHFAVSKVFRSAGDAIFSHWKSFRRPNTSGGRSVYDQHFRVFVLKGVRSGAHAGMSPVGKERVLFCKVRRQKLCFFFCCIISK